MMAGTDALARGISQGVGGLSKALENITKKKKDEASLANVLRKKGSLLQPDRKDEFATMSLDELRGEDEAFTVGKALEREATQQAQRQQQIDMMLRKAAMDEAQSQAMQGFAGAFANAQPGNATMENFYENGDGTMPRPTPSLSDRLAEGMGQFPAAAASPQFDNTLSAMIGAEDRRGANSLFKPEELGTMRKTDVPGIYYMPTSRGGGQVVTDPTMPQRPNAEKPSDEGTIEIPDPNDTAFGPRIRIPLSVARSRYPHLLKALDAPKAPASNPAEESTLEAPRDPAKRTKGSLYLTPRGSLRWTGTGWVKP